MSIHPIVSMGLVVGYFIGVAVLCLAASGVHWGDCEYGLSLFFAIVAGTVAACVMRNERVI